MVSDTENSHPHPNYNLIFGALMVLTVVTVGASRIELGTVGNTLLALAIASVKGLLVALFFMHLKFEKKWFVIVIAVPPILFAIAYIIGIIPDIGYLPVP